MKRLYAYASHAGTFYICRKQNGGYFALFGNRLLDFSATAESVARKLAAEPRLTLPEGACGDDLQIPANLHEWQALE